MVSSKVFPTVLLTVAVLFAGMSVPAPAQDLELIQALFDDVDAPDLGGLRFSAVSPDGANVYVASESDNAVAVFSRGAGGTLTYLESQIDGVGGVDGILGCDAVVVSPDGANVYAAGAFESGVAAFARAGDGSLTFLQAIFNGGPVSGLTPPVWISLSPDGTSVYGSGFVNDSIVVFTRNLDGTLTYLETQTDGVGGVTGLDGPFGSEVSPDGSHLYVAGFIGNSIAVFARAVDGSLTFVDALFDGVGGVDGLARVRDVGLSPDGSFLYGAGAADNAATVFARNAGSGLLTFVEAEIDGTNGVSGMLSPNSVTVAPSGRQVYFTAFVTDSIAVFDRDPVTGELTFSSSLIDPANIFGPVSAGISPDGRTLYGNGFVGDSLGVYNIRQQPVVEVPTLSPVGFAALGLVLALLGFGAVRRQSGIPR